MECKKILMALVVYSIFFTSSAFANESNDSLIINGSEMAEYVNETFGYDISLMKYDYQITADKSSDNSSDTKKSHEKKVIEYDYNLAKEKYIDKLMKTEGFENYSKKELELNYIPFSESFMPIAGEDKILSTLYSNYSEEINNESVIIKYPSLSSSFIFNIFIYLHPI